ncbi:MAG: magnesium transporter [Acidobacteria bacterium]|nr:MAG: magnesium transporter [Acidobacteriota bacterium]
MDVTHPAGIADIALRLLMATLIGSGIGLDRELRGKAAGMRTHALVSLGAALIVVVTIRLTPVGFEHIDAISRAIQGIIAGVGFLGGGAILKSSGQAEIVQGLTTAASIWLVACLGIACGAGQWVASLIGLILALLILIVGRVVERFFHRVAKRDALRSLLRIRKVARVRATDEEQTRDQASIGKRIVPPDDHPRH